MLILLMSYYRPTTTSFIKSSYDSSLSNFCNIRKYLQISLSFKCIPTALIWYVCNISGIFLYYSTAFLNIFLTTLIQFTKPTLSLSPPSSRRLSFSTLPSILHPPALIAIAEIAGSSSSSPNLTFSLSPLQISHHTSRTSTYLPKSPD